VFNLDPEFGRWRRMRRIAVECYQAVQPGITAELMEFDDEERRDYILAEIDNIRSEPFSGPIRQLFEGLY